MTNGFEQHGITHLSASSINAASNDMALFLMEKLLKFRSPTNAAMARGKAAEEGIHHGLLNPQASVEECVAKAMACFDTEMRFSPDEKRERERELVPGYVENGLAELRLYGVPTGYQEKISIELDGVPVPVIGFIDWRFDQHGMVVDLKTTERLPSSLSTAHARQGAIYMRAHGNYAMRFAYTKPRAGKGDGRSCIVLELDREQAAAEIAALTNIAQRLERFLRLSKDPSELLAMVIPNFDSFYWSSGPVRAKGREVFGF
ncbi:MAG: hypothetical protein RJB26_2434 [Pseudomonadota bacterium]|jgi:hypothetical protein